MIAWSDKNPKNPNPEESRIPESGIRESENPVSSSPANTAVERNNKIIMFLNTTFTGTKSPSNRFRYYKLAGVPALGVFKNVATEMEFSWMYIRLAILGQGGSYL